MALRCCDLGDGAEGGGTQDSIWTDMNLGSTNSLRGIAQIVATIQILADWSVSTYWPWFKDLISEDK
jgi:hypothetical protein